MSIFELKNGRWRAQVRRRGVPKLDRVFVTREEAEAAEQAALNTAGTQITLAQAAELFKESSRWREYAENTKIAYALNLKPTIKAVGGRGLLELEQHPILLQAHFDKRCTAAKNEKVRLEIAALGALIRWCKSRGYCTKYILNNVERPAAKKRVRRVKREETEQFLYSWELSAVLARHARFQLALQALGCRAGELAKARAEDYDKNTKTLFVSGKTGPRLLHCTQTAIECLDEQIALNEKPYMWSAKNGPYDFQNGVKQLKKHNIVARTYHSHAGRREYISRAIEAGVPLTTLKKQTGHASVQALEAYDRSAAGTAAQREQLELVEQQMLEQVLGNSDTLRKNLLKALLSAGTDED